MKKKHLALPLLGICLLNSSVVMLASASTVSHTSSNSTQSVKANKTQIIAHDSMIFVGDSWSPEDNITYAKDSNHNDIPLSAMQIMGKVDTTTPGNYVVTYAYEGVMAIATIHVVEHDNPQPANIETKDLTLKVGDTWTAEDNFVSATDTDGSAVSFDKMDVTADVDTSKAGIYHVSYTYAKATTIATVTVLADESTVNVKDSTLIVGDKWTAKDNFVSAHDKAGNSLAFSEISSSGYVNTNVAGVYPVTYRYDGIVKTANVTVLAAKATINTKDITITQGANWSAKDNFSSAKDQAGNAIDFSSIATSSNVDVNTPGTYTVTYSYGGAVATAKVTVISSSYDFVVKNVTINAGDHWSLADNFVSATDENGNVVGYDALTYAAGKVDPNTPGVYEVTYGYYNLYKTVTVTVK